MFVKTEQFKPCWWLPNGHLQTCVAALTTRPLMTTQNELIPLNDGDMLELCWQKPAEDDAPCPTLLLMHGLEGSVQSHYIQGMLGQVKKLGWRAVVLHFRGSNGRVNNLPQAYHAGKTEDLIVALKLIQARYRGSPCIGIGYSLGANVLLKFLGEMPDQSWLKQAVAVSPPFDLAATCKYLSGGFRIYEKHFIKKLKFSFIRKLERGIAMPLDLLGLKKIKSLYEFDNQVTAPLSGFTNAEDYYNQCSSHRFLKSIQTPTLIIHAKDDPMIPKEVIPNENQLSSHVILDLHEKGGHIGFISGGRPGRLEYWLEKRILNYLTASLDMLPLSSAMI